MKYDFVVVGGGAAGFFGALACAEAHPELRVLVLEKGSALLGKVLISGGGRCNLTNACYEPAHLVQFYPRGGAALRGAFSRFQPRDTVAWFEQRGVRIKTEDDGRVFPANNRSESVVDCLLDEAGRLAVEIRNRAPVEELRALPEIGFELWLRGGEVLVARTILLATGGERGGYQLAAGVGHTVMPPVPSLFTFKICDPRLEGLAGLSVVDVRAGIPALRQEQRGPVLVTHWGLSGPAILRLSAWAARGLSDCVYQAELEINWLGDLGIDPAMRLLMDFKAANGRKSVASHAPSGKIPTRLWKGLTAHAGISEDLSWASASRSQIGALADELVRGIYAIAGKGEFKEEFVTCGGVKLDEVDFRRMESKRVPGLFFAGEVLDIDGITGGFNLQSAWTTGWIAGKSAAAKMDKGACGVSGPQS